MVGDDVIEPLNKINTLQEGAGENASLTQKGNFEPSPHLGWQPIETAPKDRFILVYCPEDKSLWLAKWQGGEWYGSDCEHGIRRTGQSLNDPDYVTGWFVSHWMPVPAPPRSSGRAA